MGRGIGVSSEYVNKLAANILHRIGFGGCVDRTSRLSRRVEVHVGGVDNSQFLRVRVGKNVVRTFLELHLIEDSSADIIQSDRCSREMTPTVSRFLDEQTISVVEVMSILAEVGHIHFEIAHIDEIDGRALRRVSIRKTTQSPIGALVEKNVSQHDLTAW